MVHTSMLMTRPSWHNRHLEWPYSTCARTRWWTVEVWIFTGLTVRSWFSGQQFQCRMILDALHPKWSMWLQQATCMFHATVCLHRTIDQHRLQSCKDSLAVLHWMNATHELLKISNRTNIVTNLETFSDLKTCSPICDSEKNLRWEIIQLLIPSLF